MNAEQHARAQQALLHIQAEIGVLFDYAGTGVPRHASFHFCPDMCWISIEHEYQEEALPNAQSPHDFVTTCERKPPACHIVLVKI